MRISVRRLFSSSTFHRHDPGRLVDGDLELVRPAERHIESVLEACRRELEVECQSEVRNITREFLLQRIHRYPDGLQEGDPFGRRVPTYHFWMRSSQPIGLMEIAGEVSLRIGWTRDIHEYYGHVGYHVYQPFRGRHYAQRSVQLLVPLARAHGLKEMWITTNPDNQASRRTCQLLGAKLVDVVKVPLEHELYQRGDHEKCRYRLKL